MQHKLYILRTLCAVFILLLFSLGMAKAEQLTVSNGTATNSSLPIDGYNLDASTQRAQFIYPASDLTPMIGGDIRSLTFFLYSNIIHTFTSSTTVKIGVTTDESFVGLTFSSAPVAVSYIGNLVFKGMNMVITLDTPFEYTGGNLILDFQSGAGNTKSNSFYGSTTQSAVGLTKNGTGNSFKHNFSPKLTFDYDPYLAGPGVRISSSDLAFGNVWSGSSSERQITLRNIGHSAAQVSRIANLTAPFSVVAPNFPITIPARSSQLLTLTYTPTVSGDASQAVLIANDGDQSFLSLSLTGYAYPATAHREQFDANSWGTAPFQKNGWRHRFGTGVARAYTHDLSGGFEDSPFVYSTASTDTLVTPKIAGSISFWAKRTSSGGTIRLCTTTDFVHWVSIAEAPVLTDNWGWYEVKNLPKGTRLGIQMRNAAIDELIVDEAIVPASDLEVMNPLTLAASVFAAERTPISFSFFNHSAATLQPTDYSFEICLKGSNQVVGTINGKEAIVSGTKGEINDYVHFSLPEGVDKQDEVVYVRVRHAADQDSTNNSTYGKRITINNSYQFAKGDGTQQNPYQIESANDLVGLSSNAFSFTYADVYFVQTNDIDMSPIPDFTPIGGFSDKATNTPNSPFSGNYDGQGYAILNLTIGNKDKGANTGRLGLFGHVENATICNVALINTTITQTSTQLIQSYGSIIGYLSGTGSAIRNCYAEKATINFAAHTASLAVGGIVGYMNTGNLVFENCYVQSSTIQSPSAKNTDSYGGVVGYVSSYDTGLRNSYAASISLPLIGYRGILAGRVNTFCDNCYYLSSADVTGVGYGQSDAAGKAESQTDEGLRSPAIVALLNGTQTPAPWSVNSSGYPALHQLPHMDVQDGESIALSDLQTITHVTVAAGGKATIQGTSLLGDVVVHVGKNGKVGVIDASAATIENVRSIKLIYAVTPSADQIYWNSISLPFRPTLVTDQAGNQMTLGSWRSDEFQLDRLVDGTYSAISYDGGSRAVNANIDPLGLKNWRFVTAYRAAANDYLIAVGTGVTALHFYTNDPEACKQPFAVTSSTQTIAAYQGQATADHWGWNIGGTYALYPARVALSQAGSAQKPEYVQCFDPTKQGYSTWSLADIVDPYLVYFAKYIPETPQGAPSIIPEQPTARFAFELTNQQGTLLDRAYATIGVSNPARNVLKMLHGDETRMAFVADRMAYCALNMTVDPSTFDLRVISRQADEVYVRLSETNENYRVSLNGTELRVGSLFTPTQANALRIERIETKVESPASGRKIRTIGRTLHLSGLVVGEPIEVVNTLGQRIVRVEAVEETQTIRLQLPGIYVVNGTKVIVD